MIEPKSQKLNILIVGATGKLGELVTKHALLHSNLNVNILIRNPQKNPEIVERVWKAGGKILQGDLSQPETLTNVTKGMHTVISTIYPMDDKAGLAGQIALIDDCIRNKVERFVPSDFAGSIDGFSKEELLENIAMGCKLKVRDYLKGKPIKSLHFWQGMFLESFFLAHATEFCYWGNAEHRYDLTTYEDTAKVVAAAVADEKRTGDVIISGNDLSILEITDIYNKVRGAHVEPKSYGSFDELKKKWIEAKKSNSTSLQTYSLSILVYIYDDRCKFNKNNNFEFPEIKFTSLEKFLIQNPDIKLP